MLTFFVTHILIKLMGFEDRHWKWRNLLICFWPLLLLTFSAKAFLVWLQGKVYLFDKVFKPNATQEKVYTEAAKSIVTGEYISILFIH